MQINNYISVDLAKLVRRVYITIPSQGAKLTPPVGPALGQVKIKVKDFCTQFNEATTKYPAGLPLKVIVFVYKNETFNFLINPPSTSFLLKNVMTYTNSKKISLLDVYKIICIKKIEFPGIEETILFRNVLSVMKSMNIHLSNF